AVRRPQGARHPRPVLVAEVRGRADQRRPPRGAGLPPGPVLGHRRRPAVGAAHPGRRQGPDPADRQERRPLRPEAGDAMSQADVPGIVSAAQLDETVAAIAEWQLPSGMVPWFPGGHADPWNHVEAAMALTLGGRHAEAERAYQWLAGLQRPDGSWHQDYLPDPGEQDKLDANLNPHVATGVGPRWAWPGGRGFGETIGPVGG